MAVTKGGRAAGQANFKLYEDVSLCQAYVLVSDEAASLGSDQTGWEFWLKVTDEFDRIVAAESHGFVVPETTLSGSDRNASSCKNRFNGTIQKVVNKFVACLTKSMKVFRSGWGLYDYKLEAKKYFCEEEKKAFKFEVCYDILKKLPKFKVPVEDLPENVRTALNLSDEPGGAGEVVSSLTRSERSESTRAGRPNIAGQRAAKLPKLDQSSAQEDLVARLIRVQRRNLELNEEKGALLQELTQCLLDKNAIQFFSRLPPGDNRATQFNEVMADTYLAQAKLKLAQINQQCIRFADADHSSLYATEERGDANLLLNVNSSTVQEE
uniref:Uncharacterized protein n=1 Tax=Spongospora subterranea TaxID=70186 RepID=A0A0H5R6M0_9EUKA|eukprot:CRZ09427.1 hypothetical protein [Spongospora subterranea]